MQKAKKKIYLDHASTTPVSQDVLKAMHPYFNKKFGNAMSFHSYGQEAIAGVEKARFNISELLNCEENEVVFTSGATEANNTVLKGIANWYLSEKKKVPHIIISKIEHDCIFETAEYLKATKKAKISYINVNKYGIVKVDELKKKIQNNTVLISIMYVNNEIGTIQPIEEISQIIKKINRKRKHKIYFHTDAVQAINYLDCRVDNLGVDFLSASGHKIYGPKGVGFLYAKKNAPKIVYMHGGEQEFGKRAGTHNVAGIIGLGAAVKDILKQNYKKNVSKRLIYKPGAEYKRQIALRNYFIDQIILNIPKVYINGSRCIRVPNNINFTFKNIEGESILLALDLKGIAASTGSACSSGSLEPSHVILAIGRKSEQAHGSVRFTIGKYTTKKDIDYTISCLKKIVNRLRKISPYKK